MSDKLCKRILHVVSAMHRGGAETMIMNLYRNIDREKVQFDFIVHSEKKEDYDDEIISMGGRIIKCSSLGTLGPIKYVKELSRIIKENGPFQAVHSHTDFQGGFVALAAKKAGIDKRICHSHNTQWVANPNIKHKLQMRIFKEMIDLYGTDYCACGIDSANFLFKKSKIDNKKILYLNNGIELEKFNDCMCDKYIKKELNIKDDEIIIGHIGRFCEQKNHKHIIMIGNYLKKNNYKFKILLVGQGPLLNEIKEMVNHYDLNENIKFLGVRKDIPSLMNIFNVFLFPSFFEGLPVVLIEAQAAGVHCLISDCITKEVDLGLNLLNYLSIEKNIEQWVEKINLLKGLDKPSYVNRVLKIKERGYEAKGNIHTLMKMYELD